MNKKIFAIAIIAFLMAFTATAFAYTYFPSYGPSYRSYNYAPVYGYGSASSSFYLNSYNSGCFGSCYPIYRTQPLINMNYGGFYSAQRFQPTFFSSPTRATGSFKFNFNAVNPFCN